jgi:hypothetical protein
MFGLETLDVLIGLITVYLTFGIACTAIVETVAAWLSLRGSHLEAALQEFLAGDLTELQSGGLGIGWKDWPGGNEWPAKIAVRLVSIFAVSLGAPFWFDLLQGFMQVRAAGVSPREKTQENSTSIPV